MHNTAQNCYFALTTKRYQLTANEDTATTHLRSSIEKLRLSSPNEYSPTKIYTCTSRKRIRLDYRAGHMTTHISLILFLM